MSNLPNRRRLSLKAGGDEPAPTSKSEPEGDPYKAGTRIDLDRIGVDAADR